MKNTLIKTLTISSLMIFIATSAWGLSAQVLFAQAQQDIAQQNYQQAAKKLATLLQLKEQHDDWLNNANNKADIYFCNGFILYKLGLFAEAIQNLEKIILSHEKYFEWLQHIKSKQRLFLLYATSLNAAGQYQKALEYYTKIFTIQNTENPVPNTHKNRPDLYYNNWGN